MNWASAAKDKVEQAVGLRAVLDAACDVFEDMLPVIRACEDPGSGWFLAFVMAGTCAANGRDALLFAPSLPPARLHPVRAELEREQQSLERAAGGLAALGGVLAAALARAVGAAADPRDREACERAAGYARDIQRMLGGGP